MSNVTWTHEQCRDCGGWLRMAFGNYVSCARCGHVFPKGGK